MIGSVQTVNGKNSSEKKRIAMDRNKIIECLEKETIANKSGYVEIPLPLYSEVLALLKEQEEEIVKAFHSGVNAGAEAQWASEHI